MVLTRFCCLRTVTVAHIYGPHSAGQVFIKVIICIGTFNTFTDENEAFGLGVPGSVGPESDSS